LQGLAEPHLVSKHAADALRGDELQESDALSLVGVQVRVEAGDAVGGDGKGCG
jgi:hypothetical protein